MSNFSLAMKHAIAARERQAKRYAANILTALEDDMMKSLGQTRQNLARGPF